MLRTIFAFLSFLYFSFYVSAQSGEAVYQFLELPVSTLAASSGGNNLSSPDADINMVFHNPALLSESMPGNFEIGYMRYMSEINTGSLAYSGKINDVSQWMAGVRYIDYGTMLWTSETDEILGTTMAKDLALTGVYSWKLSEKWRAGSSISLIYSVLDEYTSAAIAVDLGVFYNNPEKFFTAGMTIKHLGSQIVSYDGNYESMPWDIRMGITKKLTHAPFRFNLTMQNLNKRSFTYISLNQLESETEEKKGFSKFADNVFSRLVGGIDFLPGENFILSLGYNYRRASQLGIQQRTFFGGFSAGMLLKFNKVTAGASFARYHAGGGSLQMSLTMNSQVFGL